MAAPQGRILVVRGGAIGDFVLTFPVFAALRQQLPAARLEVLGYPHVTRLAQAGGLVDDTRHIEARPLAGFFAREGVLDDALRDYFAGFALVISYLYDPDEIFASNVRKCGRAQFIQGPHRPDESGNIHATEFLLKPLERLAIFDADPVPRLTLPGQCPDRSRTDRVKRLALHPGSGSERKNWPEPRWREVIERLVARTNYSLLLIGGEAEGDRLSRLVPPGANDRIELAVHRPLVELAERLAAADFFLGHDSGISHLAAALGVPGLVLWGPTNPAVWRPRSEHFEIVAHAGGLGGITVNETWARLMARLGP